MPSLLTLLLFCDFLENRLHTSNLLLLRRMFSDFYAGNEHTLQDFIRLGASIVTVMPMERTSRVYREEATRLLAQQQQMKENPDAQQFQLCVFRYLSARVATKNIFWLRDMFLEFCNGDDALLRAFVSRGNEVVSVIPADIQALQTSSMPSQLAPVSATQLQTGTSLQERPEHEQQLESGSDSEVDDDDDEITTLAELASVAAMPPSLDDLSICIMEVLDRIEEQEPWSQVFDPDTLPLPVKRPKLAAALKAFWTDHARAVWERQFWAPLVNMSDRSRYWARKTRQAAARRAFETVMRRVHQELGAKFFVQLDQRSKPHKGWWNVEPVQDLVAVAQRVGLAACLQYIDSQALQRFPVVPGSKVRFARPNNGKSKSMWSVASAMQPILREICTLKDRGNGSKRKAKK